MDAADGDSEMNKVLHSKTKFAGADGDDIMHRDDTQAGAGPSGPIQFEQHRGADNVQKEKSKDVFGIDKFLSDSRGGSKKMDR